MSDVKSRRFSSIASFFPAAAILVPVPGSSPSARRHATPSARLAVALMEHGLGKGIWFGLRRVRAVRKSATAARGARPSLRTHFDTISRWTQARGRSHRTSCSIDDVVTKGRTLLAAALRLREIFPRADVRAFALLRTMGYSPVLDQLLMPCTGKINGRVVTHAEVLNAEASGLHGADIERSAGIFSGIGTGLADTYGRGA